MNKVSVNFWEREDQYPQNFLSNLRDTSNARIHCRKIIAKLIRQKTVKSLLEVGVGGLNERLALDSTLKENPKVRFTGSDWTQKFVDQGKEKFPKNKWVQGDIVAGFNLDHHDLVYSQHVLEHCPGLNPALSNMLNLCGGVLLNIFFIPPTDQDELIEFKQYPLYHNRYNIQHILKVCEHHGFDAFLFDVDNTNIPSAPEKFETVLVAVHRDFGETPEGVASI